MVSPICFTIPTKPTFSIPNRHNFLTIRAILPFSTDIYQQVACYLPNSISLEIDNDYPAENLDVILDYPLDRDDHVYVFRIRLDEANQLHEVLEVFQQQTIIVDWIVLG